MLGLAIAALFITLNGFFVAAEFALVKVRATQLHSRVRKGEKRAIVASAVISRLDRYLSVTQFGITLASLGLGWIGEPAIARPRRAGASRASASFHPARGPRDRPRRHRLRRADVRARPLRRAGPQARRHPALGEDGALRRQPAPRHLLHVPSAALRARARDARDPPHGRHEGRRRQRRDALRGRDPRRPRRRRRPEPHRRLEAGAPGARDALLPSHRAPRHGPARGHRVPPRRHEVGGGLQVPPGAALLAHPPQQGEVARRDRRVPLLEGLPPRRRGERAAEPLEPAARRALRARDAGTRRRAPRDAARAHADRRRGRRVRRHERPRDDGGSARRDRRRDPRRARRRDRARGAGSGRSGRLGRGRAGDDGGGGRDRRARGRVGVGRADRRVRPRAAGAAPAQGGQGAARRGGDRRSHQAQSPPRDRRARAPREGGGAA